MRMLHWLLVLCCLLGCLTSAWGQARVMVPVVKNHSPAWSPDGKQLAFLRTEDDGNKAVTELWLTSATGTPAPRPLFTRKSVADTVSTSWEVTAFAWSPDSTQLLCSVATLPQIHRGAFATSPGLYRVALDGKAIWYDAVPEFGVTSFAWSPDGKQFACVAEEKLLLLSADGKTKTTLLEKAQLNGLTWQPDGRALVYSAKEGAGLYMLYKMTLPDGTVTQVTETPAGKQMNQINPRFSPDGTYLAYLTGNGAGYEARTVLSVLFSTDSSLVLLDTATGDSTTVAANCQDYVWRSDSQALVTRSRELIYDGGFLSINEIPSTHPPYNTLSATDRLINLQGEPIFSLDLDSVSGAVIPLSAYSNPIRIPQQLPELPRDLPAIAPDNTTVVYEQQGNLLIDQWPKENVQALIR